ncbi:hypothetical protein PMAYCL1PPCAC_08546, partial [Pristionchus mayeri]
KTKAYTIHLKADHSLYQHVLSREGRNNPNKALKEIISIFYMHMKAANDVYENISFKGSEGITFSVKQITVNAQAY